MSQANDALKHLAIIALVRESYRDSDLSQRIIRGKKQELAFFYPDAAQLLPEADAHHLMEQRGKITGTELNIFCYIVQFQLFAVVVRHIPEGSADGEIAFVLFLEHGFHKTFHHFLKPQTQAVQVRLVEHGRKKLVAEVGDQFCLSTAVHSHPGKKGGQLNGADANGFQRTALTEQNIAQKVIEQGFYFLHITSTHTGEKLFFLLVEVLRRGRLRLLLVTLNGFVDFGLLKGLFLTLHKHNAFSGDKGRQQVVQKLL